jgi:hypothetical protein
MFRYKDAFIIATLFYFTVYNVMLRMTYVTAIKKTNKVLAIFSPTKHPFFYINEGNKVILVCDKTIQLPS